MTAVLHLDWHLTLIGDGPLRDEIKALFTAIPAERLSWVHGRGVDEVPALLAQADVLAWPGHDEAYGISYLDAQAVGLPVVALDSGGVSETVQDGVTALLVQGLDHRDYAQALARMIGDADLREGMGAAACRFVARERTLAGAARSLEAALNLLPAQTCPEPAK